MKYFYKKFLNFFRLKTKYNFVKKTVFLTASTNPVFRNFKIIF